MSGAAHRRPALRHRDCGGLLPQQWPRLISAARRTPAPRDRRTAIQAAWQEWIDATSPWLSRSEGGNADHDRVERKAEREIGDDADRDGDQVVGRPAHRNRRAAGVAAALQGDAVEHSPGEE